MLEKDRFLAIKKMAREVRIANEDLFEAFAKEAPNDAIREKEEFIETIIDSMEDEFSQGDLGKEEKQVFRANILIPDDDEFLETYSKDKNIRNLMNNYAVSVEDIMSKITELNIYSSYLDDAKKIPIPSKKTTNKFVNEPIIDNTYSTTFDDTKDDSYDIKDDSYDTIPDLSTDDAESLLAEIENLSNAMEIFDKKPEEVEVPDEKVPDDDIIEPVIEENIIPELEEPETTYNSDMSLDDISEAVDGFVEEYNTIQTDLENFKTAFASSKRDNYKLKEQINKCKDEIYKLKHNNLETEQALKDSKNENKNLMSENKILQSQVAQMEEKLARFTILFKKIYNSIPRK